LCLSNSTSRWTLYFHYFHADLRQKEEALSKVTLLDVPSGRFRPDDELLAFLEGL
jgi:integrase/recombinase XerD